MTDVVDNLRVRYAEALESYLATPEETALNQAYEIGRAALADGLGVLDLTVLHHAVLRAMPLRRATDVARTRIRRAAEFFGESLGPFEMSFRGYRESNAHLLATNAALEQAKFAAETAKQQMVEAKEEAELANQAKSTFLSSMSHELRTPLNAILGFGQLLASETMQATEEQKQEFVYHIIKAGKHLLTLINEILDLAQIEAGKIALSLEPVALGTVLLECQAMVEPLARPGGISMIFPNETHLTVVADRTRLKQVLLNLLSNAIKYNRETGVVIIGCVNTPPERIRISVQDTGTGLNSEQISTLFQPFNRLGQEFGGAEGTGIGLVVTKRLVELMGGAISVTSTPGVGSVFWIELDATEPAASPLPVAIAATPLKTIPMHRDRATLLYVEDNPANLKLVEEIIHFRGDLDFISAPDAHLGVQLARAHLPNLILMDIHLPGMSGSEAQQILKNDIATADIPVIALTANAMPREIAKGLAAGFFRYVTKPIDIAELTEAIDSALQGGSGTSSMSGEKRKTR